MQAARTFLWTVMAKPTAKEVEARFRQFGGVPRYIFAGDFSQELNEQNSAIATLTKERPQATINLFISLLDEVSLVAKGNGSLHITGFYEPDQEAGLPEEDLEDEEDEEEE